MEEQPQQLRGELCLAMLCLLGTPSMNPGKRVRSGKHMGVPPRNNLQQLPTKTSRSWGYILTVTGPWWIFPSWHHPDTFWSPTWTAPSKARSSATQLYTWEEWLSLVYFDPGTLSSRFTACSLTLVFRILWFSVIQHSVFTSPDSRVPASAVIPCKPFHTFDHLCCHCSLPSTGLQ